MKKLVILITILLLTSIELLFPQQPYMVQRRVGVVTINGVGMDSILISAPQTERMMNEIPWKGAHGLYIYPINFSGTANDDTADVWYRNTDWNGRASDNDTTTLVTDWGLHHYIHRSFDIHQTYPVFAQWLIINRTDGDGTIKFHIYETKILYRK